MKFTCLFTEASPNKKRKIDKEETSDKEKEEKKPEESNKEEESKASCSKEKDMSVTNNEDLVCTSAEVDWVDRLQTTVVSLISTLQQKTAREEST